MAALIYVMVGLWTLRNQSAMTQLSLGVFTLVQLMWISNAFADVRLWRFLSRNTTAPHAETRPLL
jgi:hypothetical protein